MKLHLTATKHEEQGAAITRLPASYDPHGVPIITGRTFDVEVTVRRKRIDHSKAGHPVVFDEDTEFHTVQITINWRDLVRSLAQRAVKNRGLEAGLHGSCITCKVVR